MGYWNETPKETRYFTSECLEYPTATLPAITRLSTAGTEITQELEINFITAYLEGDASENLGSNYSIADLIRPLQRPGSICDNPQISLILERLK